MREHTEKQFIYLSQKQGRSTHPERSAGVLNDEHSKEVIEITYIGQSFPSLFTFGQVSCFFFHTWLALGPSPTCICNFLLRCIPPQRPVGVCPHITGWRPLPFWPSRSLPAHVQTGKFSLTSGVVILSLYFSRAQLLPLALSLEHLGENKASIWLHLTDTSCLAQGPFYLLPQYDIVYVALVFPTGVTAFHRGKRSMPSFQDPQTHSTAGGHCCLQKWPGPQWGIRWEWPTKSKCGVLYCGCH